MLLMNCVPYVVGNLLRLCNDHFRLKYFIWHSVSLSMFLHSQIIKFSFLVLVKPLSKDQCFTPLARLLVCVYMRVRCTSFITFF